MSKYDNVLDFRQIVESCRLPEGINKLFGTKNIELLTLFVKQENKHCHVFPQRLWSNLSKTNSQKFTQIGDFC
jgi:hypothetical protein